ncbi:MAG TPA: RluA family pseudouridine synthase [Candidatus Bathyarchaeia archaeon]|nr:RluA family pseudouridine synthase [Candidatus Bathyarchaeia archaeon]
MESIPGLIPPNSIFAFSITKEAIDTRLDLYITHQFPLYSRSFFQNLIRKGCISINDRPIRKSSTAIKEHDLVVVQFPAQRVVEPSDIIEKNIDVKVLYEHDHFLIISKPPHLIVHAPTQSSTAVTLVDWLLLHYHDIKHVGYIDRPGIIHRLDKNTSGLLIIPRTNYAHTTFGTLFKNRTIHKTYLALVKGHPQKTGSIDLSLARDPFSPGKMIAHLPDANNPKIRPCLTTYTVLEYFDDCSFVEIKLITGRMHQIRVHFSALGHPLLGDTTYGTTCDIIARQALHAYKLSFEFDGQPLHFLCDIADDFQKALTILKKL